MRFWRFRRASPAEREMRRWLADLQQPISRDQVLIIDELLSQMRLTTPQEFALGQQVFEEAGRRLRVQGF